MRLRTSIRTATGPGSAPHPSELRSPLPRPPQPHAQSPSSDGYRAGSLSEVAEVALRPNNLRYPLRDADFGVIRQFVSPLFVVAPPSPVPPPVKPPVIFEMLELIESCTDLTVAVRPPPG